MPADRTYPQSGRVRLAVDHPPPVLPWTLITLGTLGLIAVYVLAVLTTTGQEWDNALLRRAELVPGSARWQQVRSGVELVGPWRLVGLAALISVVGTLRHWRTALGALGGVAICAGLPQVLKAGLPRPQLADVWVMPNSLPSGHVAAVGAVVVALLVVLPRTTRPLVLLLGALAGMAMGVVTMLLSYHRISDAIASGCVMLLAWGVALVVQGQRGYRDDREHHSAADRTDAYPGAQARSNTAARP